MEISTKIIKLRNQKKMTTNKLANRAGISQSYLRQIELGNANPTVEKLEYILKVLNVSLSDFFKITSDDDIVSLINKLNDYERQIIISLINIIISNK